MIGNDCRGAALLRLLLAVLEEMADNILFPYDHLAQAVIFYHTRCPYMSINMRTPKEASTHTGEIKKGWASDRDNARKHL